MNKILNKLKNKLKDTRTVLMVMSFIMILIFISFAAIDYIYKRNWFGVFVDFSFGLFWAYRFIQHKSEVK